MILNMDMIDTKKIQQHCYTRSPKGLFRKSEGYDTVARSNGLPEDFITERLHSFCYYHPSRLMQAKRLPSEEFPRAVTVVHFPEGLTMIGQTVYVEADYTGQRSTFFTHNYVIPSCNPVVQEFCPTLLNKLDFFTSTCWEHLHELDELPYHQEAEIASLGPLPFEERRLRQLIYTLLESITGTKKVYVSLPGQDWVMPVLMWLYEHLPSDAAKLLGFTTYSREPENKKFLHLTFIDKGCININDQALERDYIFDFDSGNFSANLPAVSDTILEEAKLNFVSTLEKAVKEREEEERELQLSDLVGEKKLKKENLIERIRRKFN